jgi:hypothetical protein
MSIDWNSTHAAIWRPRKRKLRAVQDIDPVGLDDLLGIDRQKDVLLINTEHFLSGQPANNALLWGARGTGKSSLIKAVFNALRDRGLRLIQVDKHDLLELTDIVDEIRDLEHRFILFCDDLSFETNETDYKALKSVLEGSIEQPPANIRVYATSNRRHLMPESMQDNIDSRMVDQELHLADAIEEKLSLSDRFGLWLSFYAIDQKQYLMIVDHLFTGYAGEREVLHREAIRFAMQRGMRSGRVARQFYNAFSAD